MAYSGEPGQYSPSTGTFTLTVGKASTTTVAGDQTVAYGQPVPVTVAVTGAGDTPTGTVTLLQGITPVGDGHPRGRTARPPSRWRPRPSRSAARRWWPSTAVTATHTGSQDGLTVTTTKATSSVDAPDVNTTAGVAGKVTVTVTAAGVTPTGTVTIKNGATTVATGVAVRRLGDDHAAGGARRDGADRAVRR